MISNEHFGYVMLTKDTSKDFDSLFSTVIYEFTYNNKFAVVIRSN